MNEKKEIHHGKDTTTYEGNPLGKECLYIEGARVHNLKNITVSIPHNALTVVTGLSGSGKSSIVFDVVYAEGQRRFMETLNAYARQFLGNLERPDVDYISGLAPVIAIEQRTTSRNRRSTVGTITEVYDFLRLLYSRASSAYSPITGQLLEQFTPVEIAKLAVERFAGQNMAICAPLVKGRKGSYEALFKDLAKKGFLYVRVDGVLTELTRNMKVNRYQVHDIELVVDRLPMREEYIKRIESAVELATMRSSGMVLIVPLKGESAGAIFSTTLMCAESGISLPNPEPHTFSFNSPYGACPYCKGLGWRYGFTPSSIIESDSKPLLQGGLKRVIDNRSKHLLLEGIISQWFNARGLPENVALSDLNAVDRQVFFWGEEGAAQEEVQLVRYARHKNKPFPGVIALCDSQFTNAARSTIPNKVAALLVESVCPYCKGTRLRDESLCFKVGGKHIAEVAMMPIDDLSVWAEEVKASLTGKRALVAQEILKEIRARVHFIQGVGLGYLSLNRSSDSLSGGESQRIRLATQIGTDLVNVMYILDEPSIGLHPRDNSNLIVALKRLRDMGNTVIVVEHDEEMIRSADYIVDMGPRAGVHGGEVVAKGTLQDIIHSNSLSADYLAGRRMITYPAKRRKGNGNFLRIIGAKGNNLKNVNCSFPLGTFICITGVAGSGKSSLVNDTLQPILSQHLYRSLRDPLPYERVEGLEYVDKVIQVDQSALGRTPRSNPATYTGLFTDVRKLFANTPEAKMRGYAIGRFSFNVAGGRCEKCKGAGLEVFEMQFLPDVQAVCTECRGQRYNRETLAVRYRGKNIAQVLDMTINQAADFFSNVPPLYRKLSTLQSVGVGYVKLGQASTTLSGGESQRIRLASELSKRDSGNTVYIFDEPTTGLHFEDIRMLLSVLQSLVDKGNTVIVIEHQIDVVKCADWVIDMGPESGEYGGKIVVAGTPEEVAASGRGHTAQYLAEALVSGVKE